MKLFIFGALLVNLANSAPVLEGVDLGNPVKFQSDGKWNDDQLLRISSRTWEKLDSNFILFWLSYCITMCLITFLYKCILVHM